jgi:hypothetical protein
VRQSVDCGRDESTSAGFAQDRDLAFARSPVGNDEQGRRFTSNLRRSQRHFQRGQGLAHIERRLCRRPDWETPFRVEQVNLGVDRPRRSIRPRRPPRHDARQFFPRRQHPQTHRSFFRNHLKVRFGHIQQHPHLRPVHHRQNGRTGPRKTARIEQPLRHFPRKRSPQHAIVHLERRPRQTRLRRQQLGLFARTVCRSPFHFVFRHEPARQQTRHPRRFFLHRVLRFRQRPRLHCQRLALRRRIAAIERRQHLPSRHCLARTKQHGIDIRRRKLRPNPSLQPRRNRAHIFPKRTKFRGPRDHRRHPFRCIRERRPAFPLLGPIKRPQQQKHQQHHPRNHHHRNPQRP